MLISILSMSLEILAMLCTDSADALVPCAKDLKPKDLLSPRFLTFVFKKLNLF